MGRRDKSGGRRGLEEGGGGVSLRRGSRGLKRGRGVASWLLAGREEGLTFGRLDLRES